MKLSLITLLSSFYVLHTITATSILPPWPLEGTVDYVKQLSQTIPLQKTTGLTKKDYLTTINGVVQFFRQYQNASGNIIDPYRGLETQYATPCFAFACATVYTQGLDNTLLNNCTAAVSATLDELAYDTCADGHCVFYMKPIMFSYRLLSPLVSSSIKAQWDNYLTLLNPWNDFKFPSNNWGLVGTLDMLRTTYITNFGNTSWWMAMLDAQLSIPDVTFTPNGLYQDHSGLNNLNPLPYDTFPISGYLTVMLKEGYNLTWAPFINETVTRGAWSHMLMQSPWGEIPTGGRSSQHTWNEAVSAVAYEIFASYYNDIGDTHSACMFKRAAHLSHGSVRRWQNPSGSFQIVKNHFDPSLRWGYEEYSYLSNYNLLPASMLAAAYMYSDDSIPECSAPADVGGFVFELPEHHLVIGNVGGVYVEIETYADPHYDPMGLHRIHINTCGVGQANACVATYALLSPTAGPPFFTPPGSGIAIGPWWSTAADAPDSRTALAGFNYSNVAGISFVPGWNTNQTIITFSIEYYLLLNGAIVTQDYTVSVNSDGSNPQISVVSSVNLAGGIAIMERAKQRNITLDNEHIIQATKLGIMDKDWVTTSPAANLTRFGTQFPVFQYDGATNTTANLNTVARTLTISGPANKSWGTIVYSVPPPQPDHQDTWIYDPSPAAATVCRNGLMGTSWVETNFSTSSPSMTQIITATN